MRIALAIAPVLLVLTACSGGEGTPVATDPASEEPSAASQRPSEVPAAPGTVRSRDLATVMDTGRPELCLGPVAESYPPQCGGPEITNWDWKKQDGMFEQQGDVRWGTFAVTGTFDGTAFTLTEAIPGALYDAMPQEPPVYPEPSVDYSEQELQDIAEDVGTLPGAQGANSLEGNVLVDVLYDDGSIQDWATEEYGEGVVVVTSALVDAT